MKFKVGDRVVFSPNKNDEEDCCPVTECGIIVHVWDDKYGQQDCYVAFFGKKFPDGEPKEKPYILRYYSSSLNYAEPEYLPAPNLRRPGPNVLGSDDIRDWFIENE